MRGQRALHLLRSGVSRLASVSLCVDTAAQTGVKLILDFASQREQPLKQRGNFTNRNGRRARVSALIFLCLTAHALFVSLTHHHDTPLLSHTAVVTASDNDSPTAKDKGSDAGCLSCSLQRNFVADPHAAAISVEPIIKAVSCERLIAEVHTQRFATSLFGRAPPRI
ncbi:MAG: hypothetical protein V7641_1723 [Blastocatellia bacterium]